MQRSKINACNAALGRLGEARITDTSEDNAAARACDQNFDLAMEELLRAHWWNFAIARATLSQATTAPQFGYLHAYSLPADCLRVLEVNGIGASGDPGDQWEVEGNRLLHDAGTVKIRYIQKVTE